MKKLVEPELPGLEDVEGGDALRQAGAEFVQYVLLGSQQLHGNAAEVLGLDHQLGAERLEPRSRERGYAQFGERGDHQRLMYS